MSVSEGSVLSERYKLLKLVGTGGMAYVYKAEDVETGEIVAIKILKEEYCGNEDFVKRFKNEAFAASKLSHANIVSVYEVKNEGNDYYIVMEYVDGLTLKDYLTGITTLRDRDALKITAQILSAVEYAHGCGIIHRDIKPMNIMISNTGIVKLTDFGIARAATGETISTSASAGSVHYISPEQARGGYTDERSDIYSIGITLYEMIMGVVPFDGENVVTVIMKHLKERIVPPKEIDPDIPAGVNDLVIMATMKDASKRFQSAAEMLARVKKVLENPDEPFLMKEDDDVKIAGEEQEEEVPEIQEDDDDVEYIVSGTDDTLYTNKGDKARSVIIAALSYLLAAAAGVVIIIWLINLTKNTNDRLNTLAEVRYTLENYVNMNAVSVTEQLESKGIKVEQIPKVIDELNYPDGYILSQEPAEGATVSEGDVVKLEISCQAGSFILDTYSGKDFREVNQELVNLGIKTTVKYIESRTVPEGFVVRTSPAAGIIVTPGDTVVIYNSSGSIYSSFEMPDLRGKTLDEAEAILDEYKLVLKTYAPMPGQDVDEFLGNKTPVPSETPMPDPSETPDNQNSPKPEETPEPEKTPEISPEIPENSQTPENTFEPLATPTPTPTIIPTPTPTPTPRIAENVIVDQYPKPGTLVCSYESICFYFYNMDEMRKTKEMIFNFPTDCEMTGRNMRVRIDAVVSDGDGLPVTLVNSSFAMANFPIKYSVPLSLNGGYTKVSIYIDGSKYSEINVYDN